MPYVYVHVGNGNSATCDLTIKTCHNDDWKMKVRSIVSTKLTNDDYKKLSNDMGDIFGKPRVYDNNPFTTIYENVLLFSVIEFIDYILTIGDWNINKHPNTKDKEMDLNCATYDSSNNIVAGFSDGSIVCYDTGKDIMRRSMASKLSNGSITDISFLPDGRLITLNTYSKHENNKPPATIQCVDVYTEFKNDNEKVRCYLDSPCVNIRYDPETSRIIAQGTKGEFNYIDITCDNYQYNITSSNTNALRIFRDRFYNSTEHNSVWEKNDIIIETTKYPPLSIDKHPWSVDTYEESVSEDEYESIDSDDDDYDDDDDEDYISSRLYDSYSDNESDTEWTDEYDSDIE